MLLTFQGEATAKRLLLQLPADCKIKNSGNCHTSVVNAVIAACFAHSCKPEPQPKWFPGRCHTAASAPENLSDTRSEVSTRLKRLQSSTLPRRHYSLTWPFANLETVNRMVLSQWSVADTCMGVFLLNWIGGRMSHQLATWAKHWTRANVCPFSMAKFVKCSTHSCSNRNRQCDS